MHYSSLCALRRAERQLNAPACTWLYNHFIEALVFEQGTKGDASGYFRHGNLAGSFCHWLLHFGKSNKGTQFKIYICV